MPAGVSGFIPFHILKQYFTICIANYFTFAVRQIFHLKIPAEKENRLIGLSVCFHLFTKAVVYVNISSVLKAPGKVTIYG